MISRFPSTISVTERPHPPMTGKAGTMATVRWMAAAALSCLAAGTAGAQDVALSGILGNKPLLVVNGSAPRAVAVGETHMGVKVLSTAADRATVLSEGQRFTIRLGESPVHIGGAPAPTGRDEEGMGDGRRIVLTQTGGGHFVTHGTINGKTVRFVVDTGATLVAMGVADAERLGLAYKKGARLPMQTANGVNVGWGVTLDSVRLKGVQIHGVEAVVTPANMGVVLLGNSFLNRFTMTRNGDQMILERRY